MTIDDLGAGGIAILLFLSAWFLISIPHQFTNKWGTWVKRMNVFGLIPGWTFFAPTPGTTDYRFVFRDVLPDGYSDWREVQWCRPRRLLDAVWHPQRHRAKLIVDSISALMATVREMKRLELDMETGWMISVPYMALLNVAVSMPRASPDATARQFAIIEQKPTEPLANPRVLVCSPSHDFQ